MRILAVVIYIGIICSSTANLFFSLPNDETLSVMTIVNTNSEASDKVFVTGGNHYLQLEVTCTHSKTIINQQECMGKLSLGYI